jgi:hypothetical protein
MHRSELPITERDSMPDIPAGVIVTAITTLASGGISAIITNALNVRRSTQEKLWELRRVAYGSILAEMRSVEYVLDAAEEHIQEDEMRYFHGEISNRHNETISGHMSVVRKSYMDNYLILSDAFISEFEVLLGSLDDRNPNLDPSEAHEQFASAVRAARPKLLRQARTEMPVRLSLWQQVCRSVPWRGDEV